MKRVICPNLLRPGSVMLLLVGHVSLQPGYVRYVHGDLEARKRDQAMVLPIEMFSTTNRSRFESNQPYFAIHRTPDATIGSLRDGIASYVVTLEDKRYTLDVEQARTMNREVGSNDIKLKYCVVSRKKGEFLVAMPTKREWPSGHYAYEGTFLWNPERRSLKFLGNGAPYGEIGRAASPVLIRYEYLDGQKGRIGLSVVLPDRIVDVKVPSTIDGHKAETLWAVLSPDRAALVVDAGPPRWLFSLDEFGNQRRER